MFCYWTSIVSYRMVKGAPLRLILGRVVAIVKSKYTTTERDCVRTGWPTIHNCANTKHTHTHRAYIYSSKTQNTQRARRGKKNHMHKVKVVWPFFNLGIRRSTSRITEDTCWPHIYTLDHDYTTQQQQYPKEKSHHRVAKSSYSDRTKEG